MTPQYDSQPLLKTVEFLACGLPMSATHTAGTASFIRHGEKVLLVKDDPRSLAGDILLLAPDPALPQKLAFHACSSVAKYNWGQIVQGRSLPVYEQLLGARADASD